MGTQCFFRLPSAGGVDSGEVLALIYLAALAGLLSAPIAWFTHYIISRFILNVPSSSSLTSRLLGDDAAKDSSGSINSADKFAVAAEEETVSMEKELINFRNTLKPGQLKSFDGNSLHLYFIFLCTNLYIYF